MPEIRFGKAAGNIVGVIVAVWDVLAWVTDSGFLGMIDLGLPEYGALAAGLVVYFGWWNWEEFQAQRPSKRFMSLTDLIVQEMPSDETYHGRDLPSMVQSRLHIATKLYQLKVPCPDPVDVKGWAKFAITVGAFAKSGDLKLARRFATTHFPLKVPELPHALDHESEPTLETDPSPK